MKILKISSIIVIAFLSAVYVVFLFVLPNCINLSAYEPDIQKALKESTGFNIKAKDMKLATSWNLSVGFKSSQVDLIDPSNEKFLQVDNFKIRLSLLPFVMKKIQLDMISADSVVAKLMVESDGKLALEKSIEKLNAKNSKQLQKNESSAELPFGLKLSDRMPNVEVKSYKIIFIDAITAKKYSINGSDFILKDFVLGKKFRIATVGDFVFDKSKQVDFDIKLFSKVFPEMAQTTVEQPSESINIIKVFEKINKSKLTASIVADLILTGSADDIKVDGNLIVDKVSMMIGGIKLPESNLQLRFKENKIKIASTLYTAIGEKAYIEGFLKYGKKPIIDLNVKSQRLGLSNIVMISNSLLQLFGINDLNSVIANGNINADFKVKSDFKKIESNGFLKVSDANIFYKLYNVKLSDINANIDFSNNMVNIKKATAKTNGALFEVNGSIDSEANADLVVLADKLPLKALLATFGKVQLLKENVIDSGNITLSVIIKGKLDKIKPQINVLVENINIKNKPSNAKVLLSKATITALTEGTKTQGKVIINNLKVLMPQMPLVAMPLSTLTFNEKDINFDNVYVNLNKSRVDILGGIKDYSSKKLAIDIISKGLIYSSDIKAMIPKNMLDGVSAIGKIPLIIKLSGDATTQEIATQMLANSTNHVSFINIASLAGKTSLINANVKLTNGTIKIHDVSLSSLSVNRGLSNDFNANIANASKIISVKGGVAGYDSKNPSFQYVTVNIPNQVDLSMQGNLGLTAALKGNLTLNGNVNKPEITGQINLPHLSVPLLKTYIKNLTATMTKSNININCPQLAIDNSKIAFNSLIDGNFAKGIIVKSVDLNAEKIDLDTLMVALSKMPQNANAPGTDLPVVLNNGKGRVNSFKLGGLVASNANVDFTLKKNILYLKNLTADVYSGTVAGNINYNLLYNKANISLQGRNMLSAPALKGLSGMDGMPNGRMDFDALNLSFVGSSDYDMMHSLRGDVKFIIKNGQMGALGKLENLLYAQNILTNSFFKMTLGSIAKAVSMKRTGDFEYIKGSMSFANGWAKIASVTMSGPSMSMYISGRYNLLTNYADLSILGRLSEEIVQILGPLGEFSFNKLISSIPKIGVITSNMINQMTINPSGENISMIPPLSSGKTLNNKEFKVSIDGNIESPSAVKYFKWLSTPKAATVLPSAETPSTVTEAVTTIKNQAASKLNKILPMENIQRTVPTTGGYNKKPAGVADFINALPNLKQ